MTDIIDVDASLPRWMWMWLIAGTIFALCKGVTLWPRRGEGSLARRLAYLFACPSMDACAFFSSTRPNDSRPAVEATRDWRRAIVSTLVGLSLLVLVAPRLPSTAPLARASCSMLGLVLLLHFGLLQMLTLAWRDRGYGVEPLMLQPLRSRSLADFWGRRWNTAFRSLSHDYVFRPLRHPLGTTGAMIATFLASGIVHDVVISIPARGGYGLPTLYFVIQCAGVLFERSKLGRNFGLTRGTRGWLYACTLTIAPLPLLFHRPFVLNVMQPFFATIHWEVPMPPLELLLVVAGVLHLCITSAGLVMTVVLDWRRNLAPLSSLTRHIIWTHGAFVLLTIIGFGAISLLAPTSLASGAPLGRAVCGFIAIFWALRLLIGFTLFDPKPILTSRWLAAGYHGLNLVFVYFTIVYGLAAVLPHRAIGA